MNNVLLNLDFTKRVITHADDIAWKASAVRGVHRKQFERAEEESGRTTSLVRFDPGTSFTRHEHPKGEEILVLEGIFSDEYGDYPAGTYLRNPPGSRHAPFSEQGCLIFVKLDHFQTGDCQRTVIRPEDRQWLPGLGNLMVAPLHDYVGEHTALVKWPKGERFKPHKHWGGEEILVLDGLFSDEHGDYPCYTWMRSPHLSEHNPFSIDGTLIFVKTGHLPE